jgi:pyruvate-formate lyase-activating enzyme
MLRAQYAMLGLVSGAFPYRIPGERYGKYGSLVMVAPCNMACPYCDVGGYAKDREHRLPGWRMIDLPTIERFVDEEIDKDRVIYLTGGEPLMFPELVKHLGQRVRRRGGYSVVCTNATHTRRLRDVRDDVDEFSISLKGTAATADRISGISGPVAFAVPHRNSLMLAAGGNVLEFVVVLFDDLTFEDIHETYEPFIGRAFITLKQFRPKVTRALEDHTYLTLLDDAVAEGSARPMDLDRAHDIFKRLADRYPDHAEMMSLVTGGGQEQTIHTASGDQVFVK